jgi:hypothetical protein
MLSAYTSVSPYTLNDRDLKREETRLNDLHTWKTFANDQNFIFEPTSDMIFQMKTDYDTFPYPRWFRGDYEMAGPVVAERRAGWRRREDWKYKIPFSRINEYDLYPEHCWQYPCSVRRPSFCGRCSDSGGGCGCNSSPGNGSFNLNERTIPSAQYPNIDFKEYGIINNNSIVITP